MNEVQNLRRCTTCLLPETFPFIEYNEHGACIHCQQHRRLSVGGKQAFLQQLQQQRKEGRNVRCLVPLSGGRDSCYALHVLCQELGLPTVAYSYDWGMITDLARRNQSRMCAKLGVEHILVSADIHLKRKYIRSNVSAWLKQPHLGTIPLFMAGDKQYFYHAYRLKKQNNLDIIVMGENPLEKTHFKVGFTGAQPTPSGSMAYHLSPINTLRLLFFYAKQYTTNLAFLNSSLWDTASAFACYYIIPHRYVNLYKYISWDEKRIIETLRTHYDWEMDPETTSTWRIGDGTAAFYNYIYYLLAGFTEHDTFRSNQIREGMIGREEALHLVQSENLPRWTSLKWYCDTIGLDFETTITRINSISPITSSHTYP